MEETVQTPYLRPTVGRIVYFKSHGSPILPDGTQKYPSINRAAMVTAISTNPDGTDSGIDLVIFNPEGLFFKQNVMNGQEGGQWDWMPFQKDQQARLAN